MRPWSQLAPTLKAANRSQAADIGRKLTMIGATVATKTDPGTFTFTQAEIEQLAEVEHNRWIWERTSDGWEARRGPRRRQETPSGIGRMGANARDRTG
jgi:hypothetical protein